MLNGQPIGFIGAGVMARAIIKGLIHSKKGLPKNIWVSDVDRAKLKGVTETFGVQRAKSNSQCVENTDIALLAVKPQDIKSVLNEIGSIILKKNRLIISIVAGVKVRDIQTLLLVSTESRSRIIRVMPNTPARIDAGMTVLYNASPINDDIKCAEALFGTIGDTMIVRHELLLDVATGLSGSGPAFTYMFIDALATGGVLGGLTKTEALRMAAVTVMGAAKMVLSQDKHPAQLKDEVTSPGGTAIEACMFMERNGFNGIVSEAVNVATQKSRFLSQNNQGPSEK